MVVGGGIAGVSAAAHLAPHGSVILLEMEPALAYHTTGRSAALFVVNYGSQGVRPLSLASRRFLEDPPPGAVEGPLLADRGLLWVATPEQAGLLEETAEEGRRSGAASRLVGPEVVLDLVPAMRPERVGAGLYEGDARDIDVAALHQAFVRIARAHGTDIRVSSPVTAVERTGGRWRLVTPTGDVSAPILVNAAGAWGDELAALAGLPPVGLQPMRRTAFMVPGESSYSKWPMVVDAAQAYYFRPDGVQLLCSLAEEEPDRPGDPRPRMEDVALAVDRINQATTLGIRTVNSQWTGLRTFAPDREMVIGEDPAAPGFFWLVGQGGTGIQTSPACGSLLASLVLAEDSAEDLARAGVDPDRLSPARFR